MKKFVSFLLKIGILAGIVYAAVVTNPGPEQHRSSIEAKVASLKEKDVLGQADRMMYANTAGVEEEAPMTYHTYYLASKVTDTDDEMLSFGFFGKVFVTQNEL